MEDSRKRKEVIWIESGEDIEQTRYVLGGKSGIWGVIEPYCV